MAPPPVRIRIWALALGVLRLHCCCAFTRPALGMRLANLGLWRLDVALEDVPSQHQPLFLNLLDDGSVSTAAQSERGMRGRWTLKDGEFKLGLDRDVGPSPLDQDVRFVGALAPDASAIQGTVIEGQLDPFVVGRFSMQLMPDPFRPATAASLGAVAAAQAAAKAARPPRLSDGDVNGGWVLSCSYRNTPGPPAKSGQSSSLKRAPYKPPVVYEVDVACDGTFKTVKGFGRQGPVLSGWWKLMAEDDVLCLEAMRGMSLGVAMTADYIYWGSIQRGNGGVHIKGTILYGTFEPLTVGKFEMRRKSAEARDV